MLFAKLEFMMRLLCLFLPFLFFSQLFAADFSQAVKDFQSGQIEPAYTSFVELDKQHPNNPTLLFNMGLIQYKTGKRGLALGLWRKARYFGSHPQIETAIAFVEEELGMATTNEGFINTMAAWIRGIPVTIWLALLIALTLVIGWPATTFFAKRKAPLNHWPSWIFAFTPVWLLCLIISIWLSATSDRALATVIETDISTRTGPSLDSPTLTSLDEGSVVRIVKSHENWVQVDSGSPAPGWVLKDKLIAEKGTFE